MGTVTPGSSCGGLVCRHFTETSEVGNIYSSHRVLSSENQGKSGEDSMPCGGMARLQDGE